MKLFPFAMGLLLVNSLCFSMVKAETIPIPAEKSAEVVPTQHPKISLNTATIKELLKIKGIKPNHAKALIRYRKKHGGYKSVEEVASVKGFKRMKPQTLKLIEEQLML